MMMEKGSTRNRKTTRLCKCGNTIPARSSEYRCGECKRARQRPVTVGRKSRKDFKALADEAKTRVRVTTLQQEYWSEWSFYNGAGGGR
jgi:hypothetical protein